MRIQSFGGIYFATAKNPHAPGGFVARGKSFSEAIANCLFLLSGGRKLEVESHEA
jgi:hypothetical protein